MESYVLDWLTRCCAGSRHYRHRLIGSSFYFGLSDSSLTPPGKTRDLEKQGVSGEPWMAAVSLPTRSKFESPPQLPKHLHWFFGSCRHLASVALRGSRCRTSQRQHLPH